MGSLFIAQVQSSSAFAKTIRQLIQQSMDILAQAVAGSEKSRRASDVAARNDAPSNEFFRLFRMLLREQDALHRLEGSGVTAAISAQRKQQMLYELFSLLGCPLGTHIGGELAKPPSQHIVAGTLSLVSALVHPHGVVTTGSDSGDSGAVKLAPFLCKNICRNVLHRYGGYRFRACFCNTNRECVGYFF